MTISACSFGIMVSAKFQQNLLTMVLVNTGSSLIWLGIHSLLNELHRQSKQSIKLKHTSLGNLMQVPGARCKSARAAIFFPFPKKRFRENADCCLAVHYITLIK